MRFYQRSRKGRGEMINLGGWGVVALVVVATLVVVRLVRVARRIIRRRMRAVLLSLLVAGYGGISVGSVHHLVSDQMRCEQTLSTPMVITSAPLQLACGSADRVREAWATVSEPFDHA